MAKVSQWEKKQLFGIVEIVNYTIQSRMKQYDYKARKWITQEEYDKRYPPHKDKEICRGKKPHDWILVLPNYVGYTETYRHNPEVYYKLMEEAQTYSENLSKRLLELGIKSRYHMSFASFAEHKLYICSVCKKQKTIYKNS